ncbi:MAG: hypothetical protein JNK10_08380, partial [Cyclobacteriaceae bacterium]|nr:hypothetical protein [Cyclobacteriaceae bacterium]
GEFDFHFPSSLAGETFVISMLGYANFEVTASSLLQSKPREILLVKSTTVLNTLVVSDTLSGGDILRIALMRMERNHPSGPYLVDAFYRDLKKIGGTYVSLLEAAIKVYDDDFREPRNKFKLRERVQLLEVRRSLGYSNRFTKYFDEDNLLEEVLLHNNIRYRQFPEEEVFFKSLSRLKNTVYNDLDVFVISHGDEFKLTMFVDQKTFGIIRMEYENNEVQPINKKRGLMSKFVGLKKTIDYKYHNGKLYLNYMEVLSKINWYDIKSDTLAFETELAQHLMINQVYTNTDERIGITSKMRRYGLQYQDLPYNKEFWDKYNVIKESPLDARIIADLERDGPLDKQFEKY